MRNLNLSDYVKLDKLREIESSDKTKYVYTSKGLYEVYYGTMQFEDEKPRPCLKFAIYGRNYYYNFFKGNNDMVEDNYEMSFTYPIYDLMPGNVFLEYVKNGCFIDYDGTIAQVFVDGYASNLGLKCRGINQGKFMLDDKNWERYCKFHEIWVNWANKGYLRK